MQWMTIYFTVAVWSSILLMAGPTTGAVRSSPRRGTSAKAATPALVAPLVTV